MTVLGMNAHTPPAPRRALAALLLLLLFAHAAEVRAQEAAATPAPRSQRELELEEQKRIITLEKEIALAEKEIREAAAKPASTPLAGTTTTDANVNIEASMLSFRAVADVSDNIACEIREQVPGARSIAIFNARDFNDWRNYKTLSPTLGEQLDALNARYDELLGTVAAAEFPTAGRRTFAGPLTGSLLAGSNAVRAFVDLISIFRTDTEIKGVAVTVKPSALTPEMLRALRAAYSEPAETCGEKDAAGSAVKLFYPEVFSPKMLDESPTVKAIKESFLKKAAAEDYLISFDVREARARELREAIKEAKGRVAALGAQAVALREEKAELGWQVEEVKATPAHTELAKVRKKAQLARLAAAVEKKSQAIAETEDASVKAVTALGVLEEELKLNPAAGLAARERAARLRKLNEQFDKFMESFVKPDASGNSGLAMFVKAENMEKALEGDESYWLQVEPVLAGGNNRTQRNLIRYFIGAKLTHSGGVIAEYVLANKKGEVLRSNTTPEYTGYRSSSRIK